MAHIKRIVRFVSGFFDCDTEGTLSGYAYRAQASFCE